MRLEALAGHIFALVSALNEAETREQGKLASDRAATLVP
jgi:hypothetical protein